MNWEERCKASYDVAVTGLREMPKTPGLWLGTANPVFETIHDFIFTHAIWAFGLKQLDIALWRAHKGGGAFALPGCTRSNWAEYSVELADFIDQQEWQV